MADVQRRATLARLKTKKAREKVVTIELPLDGEGDVGNERVEMLFRSISATEYDKLVTQFPPTPAQKKEGAVYNLDRFAPALLASVCVDPEMTVADATELWTSDAWNRGELFVLFREAVDLCISGMPLDPTETDSE